MSSPSSSTRPARLAPGTSSCIRLRMRRNVDLPQPDGPIRAVTRPAGMTRSTCSSTWCSPNHALTCSATSVAGWPTSTGGRSAVPTSSTGGCPAGGAEKVSVVIRSSQVGRSEQSQGVGQQEGEVLVDVPEHSDHQRQRTDPDDALAEPEAGGGGGDSRPDQQEGPQHQDARAGTRALT